MPIQLLRRSGEPSKNYHPWRKSVVIGKYPEYLFSTAVLQTIIHNKHGIRIPHKTLKNHKLSLSMLINKEKEKES